MGRCIQSLSCIQGRSRSRVGSNSSNTIQSKIMTSRNLSWIYLILAGAIGCHPAARPLPRIAIAGLGIESSTFSPAQTDEPAFHAKYGVEVFTTYPFMAADSPLRQRAIWIP